MKQGENNMTNPQLVKALKERLTAVDKRIAENKDFKERELILSMLAEGATAKEPILNLKPVRKYQRDNVVPSSVQGGKMAHVYNTIVDILKANHGEMAIPLLNKVLKKDHKINTIIRRSNGKNSNILTAYIQLYNKTEKSGQQLKLWPEKTTGECGRYQKIILVKEPQVNESQTNNA